MSGLTPERLYFREMVLKPLLRQMKSFDILTNRRDIVDEYKRLFYKENISDSNASQYFRSVRCDMNKVKPQFNTKKASVKKISKKLPPKENVFKKHIEKKIKEVLEKDEGVRQIENNDIDNIDNITSIKNKTVIPTAPQINVSVNVKFSDKASQEAFDLYEKTINEVLENRNELAKQGSNAFMETLRDDAKLEYENLRKLKSYYITPIMVLLEKNSKIGNLMTVKDVQRVMADYSSVRKELEATLTFMEKYANLIKLIDNKKLEHLNKEQEVLLASQRVLNGLIVNSKLMLENGNIVIGEDLDAPTKSKLDKLLEQYEGADE